MVDWLSRIVRRIDRDCIIQPRLKAEFFDAVDVHGVFRIALPTPFTRPDQEQIDSAKQAILYRMTPHFSQFVSFKERLRFEGSLPCCEIIGTLWVVTDKDGELSS